MINRTPEYYDALGALVGRDKLAGGSDTGPMSKIFYVEDSPTLPTEAEVQAKLVELINAWDAQAYSRNRRDEYPDWGSQLNKIYDDGLTKWKAEMVDPVKTKWPKDNSGPV